jgi:integrase
MRLHDAGHWHATLLLAQGASPNTVQERLGHADARTTLGLYAHTLADARREAAAQLDRLLRGS